MSQQETIQLESGGEISLLVDTVDNAKAQVIFAHGAGANMSHDFMNEMSFLLNQSGINVLRFNFPFMDKRALTGKRYPPDRMPKLLTCYQAVIEYVYQLNEESNNNLPLFIGGKSMGSRVAATLISDSGLLEIKTSGIISQKTIAKIKGVFCLGYPFHPTKKPDNLRLEPLIDTRKPVLIVQGERDTLGNQDEIISYQLPIHCQCIFLEDGDHSLKPRVKSGFTYAAHMTRAAHEIVEFIDNTLCEP
ncbi:alpha/beta family hydrolase [Colwellia sp. E2M01]|uniref:alpha/beta family hydrolase n=1 Tax=Colwellia sp. E2M01 TaxID=2841561 RepID=UPI001C0A5EF7|nr:alpha/beta family hydrolase [Colwellia sp. E2M01]MBU2871183.1 hypothetical protein [Colwellia sp. E2M01]